VTSRRWLVVALAIAAVLLLAGRGIATLYVDYHWYAAMGAADLWRAQTVNALLLRAASALAGGSLVFANLYAVRYSVVSLVLPRRMGNIEIGEEVPRHYLMLAVALASLLFALLFFGTIPRDAWTFLGRARYGAPFNESDPYLLRSLDFYVYWLPLETLLFYWAVVALALVIALVTFLYALTPSLKWERGGLRVSAWVRRHFGVLGALVLLVLAWSYRLDAYESLSRGSGPDGGFTWVDHRAMMPANLLLVIVSVAAAVLVVWTTWTGQLKVTFAVVTGVLLLSLVLREAVPVVAQRMAAQSDPSTRERGYVGTRAGYTRRAFGIDAVRLAGRSVAYASLGDAVRGVPVWDPGAAARAIERTRRTGDIVGRLAWERSPAGPVLAALVRLPGDSGSPASWTVDRVLATATDDRGGVVRVSADGSVPDDEDVIARPLVFEGARGYEIVADTTGRLAAPHIEGWRSRLAHAWSVQNFRLLTSDLPHPRPAVQLRRDVRERVRALAPFFEQGAAVGTLLRADSVLWLVELYSASATYPLSRAVAVGGEAWSYYRHAGTAIVNGATGRVTLVVDSVVDPMAATWVRRFPSMFTPRTALAPDLAAALPPAAEGAVVQAIALARYGPRTPFDSAGGAWAPLGVADLGDADSAVTAGGHPLLLLPDGRWSLPLPLVDEATRVRGLVVAAGGAAPELLWLPYPSDGRLGGVRERLLRATDTSSREARTLSGALRAIPLGAAPAWAQPFYTWRTDGPPTVARVAVLAADSVRTGRTLAAVAGVPARPSPMPAAPATPAQFRARVETLYEAMRAALREGDWNAFGAAYDSLGRLLGRVPGQP
jgi:uncharacterized membrane protein (UPF0182 family)